MARVQTLLNQHIPAAGRERAEQHHSCLCRGGCSRSSATLKPWAHFNCFPKSINTGCGMSGRSVFLIHGVVIEVLGTEGWISDANYSVKRTGTVAGSPARWPALRHAAFYRRCRYAANTASKSCCPPTRSSDGFRACSDTEATA